MQGRRRKKATAEDTPVPAEVGEFPRLDTLCLECCAQGIRSFQFETPSGETCAFGHGGGPGIDAAVVPEGREAAMVDAVHTRRATAMAVEREEKAREARKVAPSSDAFEIRDGDVLTVRYAGAKLQIAPYNSVELDGATYTRQLRAGDDPEEEHRRIYAYLRRKSLEEAREKLREFSEELRKARAHVSGAKE